MPRVVEIGGGEVEKVLIGDGSLPLIAGPCVIESEESCLAQAKALLEVAREAGFPLIFKASFDKANRTSVSSFRGPGIEAGLATLERVRRELAVPVLTDIHQPDQAALAAEVVDVLQIPAFLCRQTDLLAAAGATGKPVNVKKGQFVAPAQMEHAAAKVLAGAQAAGVAPGGVILTERGAAFGYGDLVVDMRSLEIMRGLGWPVVFDGTHSVQRPGGLGCATGGDRGLIAPLVRAAVAAGLDALFLEVHPEPEKALSDASCVLPLARLADLLAQVKAIARALAPLAR